MDGDVKGAFTEARALLGYLHQCGVLDARDPDSVHRAEVLEALCSGKPFSDDARTFVLAMVAGVPRKRRPLNTYRDRWIATVIARIVNRGFDPTRNDATRDKGCGHSACNIVTEMLNEIGIPLGERTVEGIWAASDKKGHSIFPSGPNIRF
jgi:hypothetical protein